MQGIFDQVPGIQNYMANHSTLDSASTLWPTLQEMIDKNERLLIVSGERYDLKAGGEDVRIEYEPFIARQNHFSLGDTIFTHDWSCINGSGGSVAANPNYLFVMNQRKPVLESLRCLLYTSRARA